jgi:large subunit ribosomal protein L15
MRIDDLKPAPGSTKAKRRVGRGIGGHGGKTAGRGTKGQRARNTVARGFEGGQMPLKQRVPKLKGFNNPFRVEYQGVNLDTLDAVAVQYDLSEVTPAHLHTHGLSHKGALIGRSRHRRRRGYRCRAALAVPHRSSAGEGQPVHEPLRSPACSRA